ncbi:hypothetical protein SMICM17S_05709 [Streptomyces microflavus]
MPWAREMAEINVEREFLVRRLRESTLRSVDAFFPRHPGLRHAGEAGWRAVLACIGPPARSAAETWGRGERFGIVPLVDGRIYLYATAATGPGTKPADHHAELTRRFGAYGTIRYPRCSTARPANPEPVDVLHHDFHRTGLAPAPIPLRPGGPAR